MPFSIYEDALARPDLITWFGIDEANFDLWLKEFSFRIHPGLATLWRRTGGGDLFESETILGPLHEDDSENVLKVNEFHWNKGLSKELVLFHMGSFSSASKVGKPQLVTLKNGSYKIEQQFNTLNDWYTNTLRAEFAERYHLRRF